MAVMILVEAMWEDQNGTVQKSSARMENHSPGGACIRLRKPVHVGARLRLQWRFEEFTGTARWRRSDGRDYLVGIQRDSAARVILNKEIHKGVASRNNEKELEQIALPVPRTGVEKQVASGPLELSADTPPQNVPKAPTAAGATQTPPVTQPSDP